MDQGDMGIVDDDVVRKGTTNSDRQRIHTFAKQYTAATIEDLDVDHSAQLIDSRWRRATLFAFSKLTAES